MSLEGQNGQVEAGRLSDNILMFCRTLRRAGLPIGPGRVLDAMAAISHCGIQRREAMALVALYGVYALAKLALARL